MKEYLQAVNVMEQVRKVVIGKEDCIKKVMCALLAKGHVLIEDIPGVGKTTMAKTFSKVMQLDCKRVQFTPDVMPSDIVGFRMYEQDTKKFVYQPGAVICNLFLADELNRTSPKTQSALLEVMEEGQVTVEGQVHELPKPFFVFATQNPYGSAGTQKLPESQLDRFLICLSMGYPEIEDELAIVKGKCHTEPLEEVTPVMDAAELVTLQEMAGQVAISDKVYDYIARLVQATRNHPDIELGLSPRATIALAKMSQSMAFISGRNYVVPEDVESVFTDVAVHRLYLGVREGENFAASRALCKQILADTAMPKMLS